MQIDADYENGTVVSRHLLMILRKAPRAEEDDKVLGYLEGEEKSSAYHAANLLAIPSRQEAMSIVVLESEITKTQVLITDQCRFDEVAAEMVEELFQLLWMLCKTD